MAKRAGLLLLTFLILFAASGCGKDAREASGAVGPGEPDGKNGSSTDGSTGVITDIVADIFSKPDIQSDRITQALFNQPVRILEESGSWTRVAAVDGSIGWTRSKFIDRDISSIDVFDKLRRIIVTSKDKSIYSMPEGGITVSVAVMGSEFYSFNQSGDAFEVYLPGKTTGWLKGSGMINLGLEEGIPITNKGDFAATALKFKGTCYLERGLSSLGMDSTGLVYISAKVNGISLPRSLEGMKTQGYEVEPSEAEEGDLVFIAPGGDRKAVTCVGVCTGGGYYIYASKSAGYVTYGSLREENADGLPAFVRRLFRQ